MIKIKNESPSVIHMAGHWDSANRNNIHEWAIAQIRKSNLDIDQAIEFNNSAPIVEVNIEGKKLMI